MKLEQQVCSLELAKRLKELGVKQESFFVWSVADFASMKPEVTTMQYATSTGGKGVDCSAFTVAEVGEMLPVYEDYGSPVTSKLDSKNDGYFYQCGYLQNDRGASEVYRTMDFFGKAMTEADARAKMLIYLLENKFITLQ